MPVAAREPMATYPHKIAVLCDLRDREDRLLLIRRAKDPNRGLHSPIGGKLDTASGESPAACARREIQEEAGIDVPLERLHLAGLISERGFEGQTNWLMFLYRVLGSVVVPPRTIREGELNWHPRAALDAMPLPQTDRQVIWPLVFAHEGTDRPGFFAVHIDCTGRAMSWEVQESRR